MIYGSHIEAVCKAAVRDHFRYGPMEQWNADDYGQCFSDWRAITVEKVTASRNPEGDSDPDGYGPTYLGTVEVTYARNGWRALYGVTDTGRAVLFAD